MRKLLFFTFVSLCKFLFAQKAEVAFNFGVGIPTEILKTKFDSYYQKKGAGDHIYLVHPYKSTFFSAIVKQQLIEKYKLNLFLGAEINNTSSEFYISDHSIILKTLPFKTRRSEYFIGFSKSFHFWENKLKLDFGLSLNYRTARFDQTIYQNEDEKVYYDIYEINYKITHYMKDVIAFGLDREPQRFNLQYSTTAQFQFNKGFYLNLKMNYSRNYMTYTQAQYTAVRKDQNGNINYTYSINENVPILNRFNLLSLNIGLSYFFNWSDIKSFKR